MASNALVRLTNNTATSFTFEVSISKPVKFVNRLVLPAGGYSEAEVIDIMPMVLFDVDFQNAIVNGNVSIAFAFATAGGAASTAGNFLANVLRFLNATTTGWQAV